MKDMPMDQGVLNLQEQQPVEDQEINDEEFDKGEDIMLQAMNQVEERLYDGDVIDGLVQAVMQAPDPVQGLVDQSVALLSLATEVTGDVVPDEHFMMFGILLFMEVVEASQAAGMQINGQVVAEAMKEFITQVITDIGGDMTDVRAVMDQMDTAQIGAALEQA